MEFDEEAKVNPNAEVGVTGLVRFSGWITEEWLAELRGINGIKKYKEMRDNDPTVGAILFAIEMLIRQVSWRIDTGGETKADKDAAEFLQQCLFEDMEHSWHETLTEILSMLPFGWSYLEMVFKKRNGPHPNDKTQDSLFNDGRIGIRKLPLRSQESFFRWGYSDDGELTGLYQIPAPDYQLRFVPLSKSLLFRTTSYKNNPEGRSLLRNSFRPYYFKNKIEEIEGIGIERDLAGLPVALVPPALLDPKASADQISMRNGIKTMITRLKRDQLEGVVFPSDVNPDGKKTGYELKLLSTGSRRQFNTSEIISRYKNDITMTVMADFLSLGHEGTGSLALSMSKTELFSVAIGAILDIICEVINNKLVKTLFSLNAFPGITKLPKLAHEDIGAPDLTALGTYIYNLSTAGIDIGLNPKITNYLLKVAGIPEIPEETLEQAMVDKQTQAKALADAKANALQNPTPPVAPGKEPPEKATPDKPETGGDKESQDKTLKKRKLTPAQLNKMRRQLQSRMGDTLELSEERFARFVEEYTEGKTLLEALSDFEFIGAQVIQDLADTWITIAQAGYNAGYDKLSTEAPASIDVNFSEMRAAKWEETGRELGEYAEKRIKGLDESTYDMVKETIQSSLKNGDSWEVTKQRLLEGNYGFSESRAETIARTETGWAYNIGYVQAGMDSGLVTGVLVTDGDADEACEEANGETWSLEEALANPLEHPNCVREFEYIFTFDQEGQGEGEE